MIESTVEYKTEEASENSPNIIIRFVANIISYCFHPIFIPFFITYFLVYIHPFAFTGFSSSGKAQTIIIVILNLILYPLLSVVLLKAVGFIDSIFLKTQKDRIIPYIAAGIFFFWTYTVFKQQTAYPTLLTSYVLGIFFASSGALLANIYFKVSMHAIGMGGWLGFFLILFYYNSMQMTWPLCLVLLITGLVCTSRLLLYVHNPKDIYMGILIGILTQLAATFILF